jgi:pyrroline-5-carboxylate reductase
MKLAIIGAGNMGGAVARGLATGSVVKATEIYVSDHSQQILDGIAADVPAIHTSMDNLSTATDANIVIVAVKPWLVQPVMEEIYPALHKSNPLIICIAAGITFEMLDKMLAGEKFQIVRVIPNTAIAIKQSPTLMSFNANVEEANKTLSKAMFDELGQAIVIEERLMAAGTAVTSCGIAYAFEYIKAAMQGAIELGFYPHVAKSMIDQTILGAVGLLEKNGTNPDTEIYKVCTPGGITIKGLNEMTKEGFDHAVIAGLKKSAGM